MRSSAQLTRTPGEYADYRRAERQKTLGLLLRELERVRLERPEWYVWVVDGQPELTPEEYAALTRAGSPTRRRERSRR